MRIRNSLIFHIRILIRNILYLFCPLSLILLLLFLVCHVKSIVLYSVFLYYVVYLYVFASCSFMLDYYQFFFVTNSDSISVTFLFYFLMFLLFLILLALQHVQPSSDSPTIGGDVDTAVDVDKPSGKPTDTISPSAHESLTLAKTTKEVEAVASPEVNLKVVQNPHTVEDSLDKSSDDDLSSQPGAPTTPPPYDGTTMIGSPPLAPFEEPSYATMFYKDGTGQSMHIFECPADLPITNELYKTNLYIQEWNHEDYRSNEEDYCLEPVHAGDTIMFYEHQHEGNSRFMVKARVIRIDPSDDHPLKLETTHYLPRTQRISRVQVVVQVGEKYQLMIHRGVSKQIKHFNPVEGYIAGKNRYSAITKAAGRFSDIANENIKKSDLQGPSDLLRGFTGGDRSSGKFLYYSDCQSFFVMHVFKRNTLPNP